MMNNRLLKAHTRTQTLTGTRTHEPYIKLNLHALKQPVPNKPYGFCEAACFTYFTLKTGSKQRL